MTPNGFLPFIAPKKELPSIFKTNQNYNLNYVQYENSIHIKDLIKNKKIIENNLIIIPISESCKNIKIKNLVSDELFKLMEIYNENFKILYITNERIM